MRFECGPAALTACALCCRKWHAAALPVLYRHVVITTARLAPFAASFPRAHAGSLIRMLTLAIHPAPPPPPAASEDASHEDAAVSAMDGARRRLWRRLQEVADAIAGGSMPKLTSFSLRIAEAHDDDDDDGGDGGGGVASPVSSNFWLPRTLLAAFVTAMPTSCVAVKIDTKGHDSAAPGAPAHLCDALRAVLPRLRHLRLRVRVMCSTIFVGGDRARAAAAAATARGGEAEADGSDDTVAAAVVAASLPTLVINCRTERPGYGGGAARVCGGTPATNAVGDPHNFFFATDAHARDPPPPEARVELALCLRRLLCTASGAAHFPAAERLWLLDMQANDAANSSVNAALNRRDAMANCTWALPFRDIPGGSERNAFLTRLPDGRERVVRLWAAEALAEGATWAEMRDGARRPVLAGAGAAMAARRSDGQRRQQQQQQQEQRRRCSGAERLLLVQSAQAFRVRFPRRSCGLWANERKTGVCLLGAVQRAGLTDTTPLRELTPPGWQRLTGGDLHPLLMLPALAQPLLRPS